jgi:2-polyprenyl-3-methyl-5-hydroxy-6-metoxy-1,4-benzoquinol methylase
MPSERTLRGITMNAQKIGYFVDSLQKTLARHRDTCPSCGARETTTVDQKLLVTRLVRCHECSLLFRTPTTSAAENAEFYQEDYSLGFTTDMPGDDELARLTANSFRGTSTDWSRYREILSSLGVDPKARILDFGASWGYGSWQLMQAGYNVTAFEISRPRCRYAREKLGVDAYDDLKQIEGTFDVVFSAHVMEHVPSVAETIEYARSILFPGGLFIAFTPNGSAAFRRANPLVWHKMWGQVHPQFLDDRFYMKAFHGSPLLLTSDPFNLDQIASWSKTETMTFGLGGPELLVVARP